MWVLEALKKGVDVLDPTPFLRPSMLRSTPDSSLQAIIAVLPSAAKHF